LIVAVDGGFLTPLEAALREVGLVPVEYQLAQMDRMCRLLLSWNQRLNLTRITEPAEIAVKHFVDSLMPISLSLVPAASRVVDVGSGAGFPGIPLKIWDDSLLVTLVESTLKKAKFLAMVADELSIQLNVVGERAEDVGNNPQHRELYDIAIARAVGPFPVLCEYCLPLVRVGGSFIAMKGREVENEIAAGERALRLLGGQLEMVREYDLPFGMGRRSLVVVRKIAAVPSQYPRRAGIPSKRPL